MPSPPAATARLLACLGILLLAACSATIKPPPEPATPRPAFLLDHGRHTTLVVVDSGGRPVRYAFGELASHANGDIGFFRGMGAMLIPTEGTLGRRVLPGPPSTENISDVVGVYVEKMYCIAVPGKSADRLQRMLNLVFEENLATATYNAGWNLEFVKHPESYWFGSTSNQAVEKWLVELGAEVEGITSFGRWRVEQPPGAAPAVCADKDDAASFRAALDEGR